MSPTASRFVRPAAVPDAADLARIQRDAWLARYGLLLPQTAVPSLAESRVQWADLVAESAAGAAAWLGLVLVAVEDRAVVGLLAATRAADPDLADAPWQEIVELAVDGAHVGQGHATRLLAAWADIGRATGPVTGGTLWVRAEDDDLRLVVTSSGFVADGAHRTLDLHGDGTVTVRMVRLSCTL